MQYYNNSCTNLLHIMKYDQALARIGLSEKESMVYVALIETGPATVSAISRKSRLHRPVIYRVLPELQARGLVTATPKGKLTLYAAEPPEKLETLLREVRSALRDEVIPELKGLFQSASSRPTVKVLEGAGGIAFVFDDLLDSLKSGETYYRYSSVRESVYRTGKYLPPRYKERRERKRIERLVITSEAARRLLAPSLERDEKIVPESFDLFDDNITQIIYADKVAFIDYNTETALIIENPVLAGFQRKLFRLLYNKL